MKDKRGRAPDPMPDSGGAPRLLVALGVVLLVLSALFLWDGWRQGHAENVADRVLAQRDRAVAGLMVAIEQHRVQFGQRRSDPAVARAIDAGDPDAAAAAFVRGWSAAHEVEFHPLDFASIMDGDLAEFGFGRLALLERAVHLGGSEVSVLREADRHWLALAGPVASGDRVLAIAMLRMPVDSLLLELNQRTPSAGYLALKQGRYVVGEAGNRALAVFADANAVAVPGTPMRVVAAGPATDGGLMAAGNSYLFGGLLLIAGLGALAHARRRNAQIAELRAAEDTTTLAEAIGAVPRAKPARKVAGETSTVRLDRTIFRAYDIRGVVGRNLDATVARNIGQAIGTVVHERGLTDIVVGRDGRHSGASMAAALIEGLRAAGCNVIDIGQAPTPLVYFAGFQLRTGSGVAVTGSHNPPDYNGFKIVVGGETLSGDSIDDLYQRIAEGRLHKSPRPGTLETHEVAAEYVARIAGDVQVERRIRLILDCGNGVAGAVAPEVLEAIGCEVVPLFCEVDGDFPNHHPDPSDAANLADLINMVQRMDAEIGIALDGDGDRLGVVTRNGEIIDPDRLLMLFAQDVLVRNPGACVIYDVKCTGHLGGHILRHGGSPVMWKTGHSLIKAKMHETEAELAGEMSGHFFFRERWYGFDDGIYAAARLLEILAADGRSPEEIFAELPKGVSTPELKVAMEEGEPARFVERFRAAARFEGARIATIDGVRADWPDGWGLVRASNTTPVLVLRFDADTAEALARIQEEFRGQMLEVEPEIELPF